MISHRTVWRVTINEPTLDDRMTLRLVLDTPDPQVETLVEQAAKRWGLEVERDSGVAPDVDDPGLVVG